MFCVKSLRFYAKYMLAVRWERSGRNLLPNKNCSCTLTSEGLLPLTHKIQLCSEDFFIQFHLFCLNVKLGLSLFKEASGGIQKQNSKENLRITGVLEHWMLDEVQKPSSSECYTPSSEPFRIYQQEECLPRREDWYIHSNR